MAKENNDNESSIKRRNYLKGLTASGAAIAGFGGISMTSLAQNGDPILAPPCGEASTPPEQPPGGQAGQCINCVREVCDTEPVALEPLFSSPGDFDGICFTLPAEDIPEGADFLTLKAGQNCFLADEVPQNAEGEVTWCLPDGSQDISNATFYACEQENPPTANVVEVTCDQILIETTNIPNGDTLNVTVTFSDGTTQTEDVEVTDDQATVELPGDLDPIHVTIVYEGNQLLFDAGVMAEDAPCGDAPAVVDVNVTCKLITIQTANIDAGEELDVTVVFEDDSQEMFTPEVDDNGVAEVELPGDLNPIQLIVSYDGVEIFNMFVEADDAPCKKKPVCPDICVKYKFKDCKWTPVSGDPDGIKVEGDETKATICADFPFVVKYATRSDHHDKKQKKNHSKNKKHESCKCKKCEVQEPVTAEFDEKTGKCCATIGDGCTKICWFKVKCPDNKNNM